MNNINNNNNNNKKLNFKNKIQNGFSLDKRSLSFFRIIISIYLLVDLFLRSFYLKKHYTDHGSFPRSSSIQEDRYSFHQLSGSTFYIVLLFLINTIIVFSLLIGFKTRLSTILSFLFLCSLQNRNHFLIDGSDDYTRTMLFFSIFLPLGEYFSIDSILNSSTKKNSNGKDSKLYFSSSSIAFLIQFNYIYIFTALFKAGDSWHVDYDSVYYALNLIQFKHGLSDFFLQYPNLMVFLTKATLIFEYVGPMLLVSPFFNSTCRIVSILGFIGMHIGFGVCLNLYLFVFIPMVTCTAFIPSDVWDYIEKEFIQNKSQIIIYYNSKSKNLKLILNIFSTFFLFGQNVFIKSYSNNNNTDSSNFINNNNDVERGNEIQVVNLSVQYQGEVFSEEKAIQFIFSKSICLFLISNLSEKYFEKLLSFILNYQFNQYYNEDSFKKNINNNDIGNSNNILMTLINNNNSNSNGSSINNSNNNNNNNNSNNSNGNTNKRSLKENLKNLFFIILMTYLLYYNICIYKTMIGEKTMSDPIAFNELVRFARVDQYWGMFAPEPPKLSVWVVSEAVFKNSNITQFDIISEETVNFKTIPSVYFKVGQRERNFLMAISYVDHLRLEFGRYYCRKYNVYERKKEFGKLVSFNMYTVVKNTPPQDIDIEELEPQIKFQYTKTKISLIWEHTC